MKYGETLRQRSIPAWSHHNIDYDDIKYFIKERTTPGKGKTISVPGRGDEKLVEFENALFAVLEDQHHRIDLFVRSKSGEIQRRLGHAKKQLKELENRRSSAADHRVPIGRLERYGRLENDVLKAGDEIRSLARFTTTQRTAFRKLLKKYKKWTGSENLEGRFREEVLDEPKSFTQLDLGPMLDDYSQTLQSIRTLFETKVQQPSTTHDGAADTKVSRSTAVDILTAALTASSSVDFDTALDTVPLGESGQLANYFVHSDCVVELQVLLLQHLQYYKSRSRTNSVMTPMASSPDSHNMPAGLWSIADYFMLVADDPQRFAHAETAVTIDEREQTAGIPPQRATYSVRWNNNEDAVLAAKTGLSAFKTVSLKRKHADSFFDDDATPAKKADVSFADQDRTITSIKEALAKDPVVQPLYKISSCRSRFTGVNHGCRNLVLATLDTHISMQTAGKDAAKGRSSDFPLAILQVRQEGPASAGLISALDKSHLVERIRGFSLQYHAFWEICRPVNISPPFWMPVLSRDIRKLPPPAMGRKSLADNATGSQSTTVGSTSTTSVLDTMDSTTANEAARPADSVPDQLETPPIRSFRKKRRRAYPEGQAAQAAQQRYWSEYDHTNLDGGEEDAYVLYIDPNEKTALDKLFDKLSGLFGSRPASAEATAADRQADERLPPSTPDKDDGSSSEEETETGAFLSRSRATNYGTVSGPRSISNTYTPSNTSSPLPQVTVICLFASLAILIVAFILAQTSKHRYVTTVDAGIIFAIICSLLLAVVGFLALITSRPFHGRQRSNWVAISAATTILIVDAVGSGGLLAWMLG